MELIISIIEFVAIVLMAYTLKYIWDLYRQINELIRQLSAQVEEGEPLSDTNEEV